MASLEDQADLLLTDMCTAGPLLTVWPELIHRRPLVIRLRADPWQTDANEERRSRLQGLRRHSGRAMSTFYHHADALIPVSDYLCERIRVATGIDGPKVQTIGEPVDLDRFSPSADRGALKAKLGLDYPLVVCVVFNFHYEDKVRGLEHFLPVLHALVERHPEVAVAIAGGGRIHPDFVRANERWLSHSRMIVTGYIDGVERLYQCSDLCAHFSFFDALPRVMFEAWACGLPIVVNDHPALRATITPGVTGEVLSDDAEPGKALPVFESLLFDTQYRDRIGANGRQYVEQYANCEVIGRQFLDLFRGVLE